MTLSICGGLSGINVAGVGTDAIRTDRNVAVGAAAGVTAATGDVVGVAVGSTVGVTAGFEVRVATGVAIATALGTFRGVGVDSGVWLGVGSCAEADDGFAHAASTARTKSAINRRCMGISVIRVEKRRSCRR
jgi:hypothetical protein